MASPRYPRNQEKRRALLLERRNLKMAASAHAYVRGNTAKFYEWLDNTHAARIPDGPPIWICGDCHLGNLGPIANAAGEVSIQIRDLDQTVIGNPAHDLIRLALSLSMAARGSDLPGITTAHMIEQLVRGYRGALIGRGRAQRAWSAQPDMIKLVLKRALKRRWRHLASERLTDLTPKIPLGKNFWPIDKSERGEIGHLIAQSELKNLINSLSHRNKNDAIEVLDAAYWVKGCSSLGRLRYAVLLAIGDGKRNDKGMCLVDIKQATPSVAVVARGSEMSTNPAARVVEGARHLAPFLGERMLAEKLLGKPVVIRELRPQDLKIEIDQLHVEEARATAHFLGGVVGQAHAWQMSTDVRRGWARDLQRYSLKTLEAPSWLWSSVIDLIATHESAYLEHCRRFAAVKA
jgi:uncharacterized protein (DUF2252 family)